MFFVFCIFFFVFEQSSGTKLSQALAAATQQWRPNKGKTRKSDGAEIKDLAAAAAAAAGQYSAGQSNC